MILLRVLKLQWLFRSNLIWEIDFMVESILTDLYIVCNSVKKLALPMNEPSQRKIRKPFPVVSEKRLLSNRKFAGHRRTLCISATLRALCPSANSTVNLFVYSSICLLTLSLTELTTYCVKQTFTK